MIIFNFRICYLLFGSVGAMTKSFIVKKFTFDHSLKRYAFFLNLNFEQHP